jgi:hypothetical protein
VNQPMAFSGCIAVADMAESSIDIAESLVGLSAATIFELHGEWRRLHRAPPPMRLSRDLLMRGITYKLQERPLGGLSTSIIRKLERLNLDLEASDAQKPARPISYERQAELGAHYPGREAPDRVGLPAGCLHDGPDGRALFALEHREHKGLL